MIYKVFARYTVREIFSTKRTEIQAAVENELKPRLGDDGVVLRNVQIGKIDLPADYRRGMESLLAEELAGEKMKYTLDLKDKQVKETELTAQADKVRREIGAEAAAREQIIAAKGQEEAMKHVLPFKQRQIEQRQLEAEAEKVTRISSAEGNAQARRIEASGEADARQKLADAEAYRHGQGRQVERRADGREGVLLSRHPLLIQKTMADKLSDKVQVIIAAPGTDGSFIGAGLLGSAEAHGARERGRRRRAAARCAPTTEGNAVSAAPSASAAPRARPASGAWTWRDLAARHHILAALAARRRPSPRAGRAAARAPSRARRRLAIVVRDQTALRAAPHDSAQQQARALARRGRRSARRAHGPPAGLGPSARARRLRRREPGAPHALAAGEAPELLAVLRFVRDTPGAEALGIGLAAAYLKAAPPDAARRRRRRGVRCARHDGRAAGAARVVGPRLGPGDAAPSRAETALAAHLEVAARYGVVYTSFERDGAMRICYDGEAFRRVLALPRRSRPSAPAPRSA